MNSKKGSLEELYGKRPPLSADLEPHVLYPGYFKPMSMRDEGAGGGETPIIAAADYLRILASDRIFEKGFLGRSVTITTIPVRIIDGQFPRGYLLINPTASTGLTSTGTLLGSLNRSGIGNTQGTPLGVANYLRMALFLSITGGGGGTVTINTQSKDPVSGNWATVQSDIFGAPAAVGTYYANIGTLGVDTDFAISFSVGAPDSTFSVGYVLKDGLPGSASGFANSIFLGGPDVNTTTGIPLSEGQRLPLYAFPNAELWAVSLISGGVTLKIFDLQ